MQLGFVGLGKMGGFMVQRLIKGGHQIVAFDRAPEAVKTAVSSGARGVDSLEALVGALEAPRAVWIMVPSGNATTQTIDALAKILKKGDTIIDGGNSRFHDSIAAHARMAAQGINFVDCGTSGGIWGLKNGYCLMVGGDEPAVKRIEPLFLTLAPEDGYAHVGGPGAGHHCKMVHNGIEYGLMQAYAEGFEILKKSRYAFDLLKVVKTWNHGSVVRSWLSELAEDMFRANPNLDGIKDFVPDSGEGRWTVQEAIDLDVPAPIITYSLLARLASRQEESFAMKSLSALRNAFGGHAIAKA